MLEEATRLGIRAINVHKGLPAIVGPMADQYVRATDLPKVARDWPRLNFVAYHSGYFGENYMVEGENVGGLTGIDEFLSVVRGMGGRRNIYAEIGSAFALALVVGGPLACAHLVGALLRDLGSKRIVWGTDSIWWGSPQWKIDAFKMLEIPANLQETYGYPPLTERDKRRILGLNAARLYRIPVRETRCQISADQFAQLRRDRETVEKNRSLRTYGPRTRREFLRLQQLEHGGALKLRRLRLSLFCPVPAPGVRAPRRTTGSGSPAADCAPSPESRSRSSSESARRILPPACGRERLARRR
jgi:hypothetical protein